MYNSESEVYLNQNEKDEISILLADDHPLIRQALKYVLEKQPDFKIVAEVGDGNKAVELTMRLVPDVVIMDISMPKLNGLEATKQIKAKCPTVAILVLTVHDDSEHVLNILEAGAAGYLTKEVFGNEIINAVRGVVAGEVVLSSSISNQVIKYALRHASKPIPLNASEKITSQELEILRMVAIGMSNKDIAQQLNLSLHTVKSYLAEIFSKLNVASRTEAVITLLQTGILTLNDIG